MENMVMPRNIFNGAYQGKKVLITGHTGFKGSWLAHWLIELGAEVGGYSAYLPSDPCNFQVLNLQSKLAHFLADTRDFSAMKNAFTQFRPQIIFHLASQPIVRRAYENPKETFDANIGGVVNLLECLKIYPSVEACVIITSDKCYRNVEWEYGYREHDELGGDDPYSASKACAEIVCRSYHQSFLGGKNFPKIATTRAGNVIGGGDWAEARIVPDCVRAWSQKSEPIIRNPKSTRPWQHVLEPLSGYLWLGAQLLAEPDKHAGGAYNFGPDAKVIEAVSDLANLFLKYWGEAGWRYEPDQSEKKESSLLKLCCDKAWQKLNWRATLNFEETVKLTAEWYKNFYTKKIDPTIFTNEQINYYINRAATQKLAWAAPTV